MSASEVLSLVEGEVPAAQVPAAAEVANKPTQPPVSPENGGKFAGPAAENAGKTSAARAARERISRHEPAAAVGLIAPPAEDDAEDLNELVTRAMSQGKRGRPAAFDEHAKGKLVALLALGLSLRQAASVLGVHHSTVASTLQAEPALQEEIDAARHQAQVQPLACIVRESRRSWKAATWLLKYLDGKLDAADLPAETPSPPPNRERNSAAPPAPGDDVENLARSLMQYLKG